jgi:hypothetical protein
MTTVKFTGETNIEVELGDIDESNYDSPVDAALELVFDAPAFDDIDSDRLEHEVKIGSTEAEII